MVKVECLRRMSIMKAIAARMGAPGKVDRTEGSYQVDDEVECGTCGLTARLVVEEGVVPIKPPGKNGFLDEVQTDGDELYELRAAMTVPKDLTQRCTRHLAARGVVS